MRYHPFVTDPAPIHEHALSNLRYIREAMERATSAFTSIPGWGGVAIGITAVITAVLAHPYAGTRRWLWTWLAEAVVAGVIALTTMFLKAQRAGVSFRDGAPRRIAYVDSLSTPGYQLIDNPRFPHIVQAYRSGFEAVRALPCDLLIAPHPGSVGWAPAATDAPHPEPMSCVEYADSYERAFDQELARQRQAAD